MQYITGLLHEQLYDSLFHRSALKCQIPAQNTPSVEISSQKHLIQIIIQFEVFLHQSTAIKLVNIDLVTNISYVAGLGVHQLHPPANQPIITLKKLHSE